MPKNYPIKTDLFRFVTTKTPDQLNIGTSTNSFIYHPDLSLSKLGSCPLPAEDNDTKFQEFLDSFRPVDNYRKIRDINPKLYDLSSVFYNDRKSFPSIDPDTVSDYILSDEKLVLLWDQLFYQILTSESPRIRQASIQMIVTNNIVNNIKMRDEEPEQFEKMLHAKLVIPTSAMACYKPWIYKNCDGTLEGITNLGIADFRKVEQEVCCYVPGEVSHIENILAREYKERSSRNLTRSEQTIEITNETEIENLTDVTTATRNEISSEISSVIDEASSSNFGGSTSVAAEYLGAKIDISAYADFGNANSSTFSNLTAKNYAEEITKRALERIVQRNTEKRTSTIIKEYEENNKHGFDNRKGDEHVTGVYRWVDIIYNNRLVNYGKRLMLEFMVPEPAEFYKRIQEFNNQSETPNADLDESITPPKKTQEFGINSPEDINTDNAYNAASYYGVNVNDLPASEITVTKSLTPLTPVNHERYTQSQNLIDISVPAEYEADIVTGSYTYEYRANSWSSSAQAFCDFSFGGTVVSSPRDYSATKETKTVNVNVDFSPNLSGNIPVSVSYSGVFGFYGAVSVQCKLKQSVITDWQNDLFNKMQSAYNQMLSQYEADLQANQVPTEGRPEEEQSNSQFNRQIELRELKRACIEMLMKAYCRKQGANHHKDVNACDLYQIPEVNRNSKYLQDISETKFFEQAFDWSLISYLFYPYYWADKCDWGELMNSESDDPTFQAFLQAGMARVVVPVREQFNEAVTYYMETGDIWLGGDLVAETENDLYLSIAEELSEPEGQVEDEWETRVPTTLAIVQDKSAKLDENGLPCCSDVENDDTTTNINESTSLLGNVVPTDTQTN